jgi:hypothetical protein
MEKEPKQMNKAQRKAIVVGIVLIVVMALLPPWRVRVLPRSWPRSGPVPVGRVDCGGYALLFAPPYGATGIDVSRLLIQWSLVGAATAGVVVGIRVRSDP